MLLESSLPEEGELGAAGELLLPAGRLTLGAALAVPETPLGLVICAYASGSGRFSPRNRRLAAALYRARLATLMLDLLTPAEQAVDRDTAQHRFNVPRLAARLIDAIDWSRREDLLADLPLGLFGVHTCAAAALVAGAERPQTVHAMVVCDSRADLAGGSLWRVQAPTLLLVGEEDKSALAINRRAADELAAINAVATVADVSSAFGSPAAIDQVAALAEGWFLRHLGAKPAAVAARSH